jgi:hypothetical protein
MNTTLNKIRANSPCADGWKKLLTNLGKTEADDKPLPLTTILESNGLDDAIWCFRAVDGRDREVRLFAIACARRVQHLTADKRSLNALDVAERFANGLATKAELDAAWDAASAAARAAARAAASAAAWDAASAAARAAASAAARVAASAAAWDAARAAARVAAWAAEREAQAVLFILMCEGAL